MNGVSMDVVAFIVFPCTSFVVVILVALIVVPVIVEDVKLDVSIVVASMVFTTSSSVFAAGKGVSIRVNDSRPK